MSSTPSAPRSIATRTGLFDRLGSFWQRVCEGRDFVELWSQFDADARSSYGFYG